MHIAIDALEAGLENKVGMGNYADNLIRALAAIDSRNNYSLYVKRPLQTEFTVERENFHYRQLNSPLIRTFWTQCRIPMEVLLNRPDILHMPTGQKIPFFHPCKTVVTIFDLAYLNFPDYFQKSVKWRLQKFSEHALRNADKIIAISESTKKDILWAYDINEKLIEVVYFGVEDKFRPLKSKLEINEIKKKLDIRFPYILFAGVLQPRKNIPRLIRAFKKIIESYNQDLQLVIAGNKGWMYEQIFQTVKQCNIGERVVFTGYVQKQELIYLMNGAEIFVLPSLYEGFGMPILEAMACGTAVVCSNTSSMPEVAGNAAVLCDPYSEEDIAKSIIQLLANEQLRRKLIARGLERAKGFSWGKSAKQTLNIYESLRQK